MTNAWIAMLITLTPPPTKSCRTPGVGPALANGGNDYYALYIEDPDRIKVEFVAT
jgi:hypothetical protein